MKEKMMCDFLILNVGCVPFEEVREHTVNCSQCKKELARVYKMYKEPGVHCAEFGWNSYLYDFDNLPPGLSKKEFFSAWHLATTRKGEELEHREASLQTKLSSSEGQKVLRYFLRTQSLQLSLIALNGCRHDSFEIISSAYNRLIEFFGRFETCRLFDMENPEDLLRILGAWKEMIETHQLGSKIFKQ